MRDEPLTTRELEILNGLNEGLSNAEIGEQLFLAPKTVKWYVRQLNQKLHTTNRDEIIQRAEELGLLDHEKTTVKHNLPYVGTAFVGRAAELTDLRRLLSQDDVQLLTILAPGGMGKTRLAIAAAKQQLKTYPNGVYFVPLQALSNPDHIVSQIATSTSFQFSSDKRSPEQQVLDYLSNKCMLLLLDNFEHLLDSVSLITEILEAAPGVRLLVTSRERLNLSVETVYPLTGMAVSETRDLQLLQTSEAVQLMIQTAQRVKPDWSITDDNIEDVIRLLHLVDGMPLGIILAASWVDVYDLKHICEQIERSADFLETEMRDLPQRHQSIRAVFETTWQHLSPNEQQVFMKMSVFLGGCTPEAAEAITGASPRTLQNLVNKALLTRDEQGRYHIHELLRQYAEIGLDASECGEATHNTHMWYYANAVHEREAHLEDYRQIQAIYDITSDFENINKAWTCALQHRHYEAIGLMLDGCFSYFLLRSLFTQAIELGNQSIRVISRDPDQTRSSLVGKLKRWLGQVHINNVGDHDLVEQLANESLNTARENNDQLEISRSLRVLSRAYSGQRKLDLALEVAQESLAIIADLEDTHQFDIAQSHYQIGFHSTALGHWEQAEQHFIRAYHMAGEIGAKSMQSDARRNLIVFRENAFDWEGAENYSREVLTISQELKSMSRLAGDLFTMAGLVLINYGQVERAEQLAKESLMFARQTNSLVRLAGAYMVLSQIAQHKGEFTEAQEYAEQASVFGSSSGNWCFELQTKLRLGGALVGLGKIEEAIEHLCFVLNKGWEVKWTIVELNTISEFANVLGQLGQSERAASYLGLLWQYPKYMELLVRQPHIIDLQDRLKEALGNAAYETALGQGKTLNLDAVVEELLGEFEGESTEN